MKICKAKSSEGVSCPNQVDEGQEYCPYHLASQVADEKKIFLKTLSTLVGILTAARIVPGGKSVIGKVVKLVVSKKP